MATIVVEAEAEVLEEGELSASEIAAAGIIEDDFGNRWTLPQSDLGEEWSSTYSPIDLPKKDPRFEYQFERTDRLGWAISDQWMPVRRSEIGLVKLNDASKKLSDYGIHQGDELDPIHTVGDLTCVKIPKQIAAARRKRAQLEAERVKATIEPPKNANTLDAKASLREKWQSMGQRVEEDAQSSTTYHKVKKEEQ